MAKKKYNLRPSKAKTADQKRIERAASSKYPYGSPKWKAYVFGAIQGHGGKHKGSK